MSEYEYCHPDAYDTTGAYLWPPIVRELQRATVRRVFDLGCGNGVFLRHLQGLNIEGVGVDPSESGIAHAQSVGLNVHVGSAYDDLASVCGQFPAVVSLEVVEHLYDPRAFARTLFDLVEPGGLALVSTPYHGYLKNLAIALAGRFDQHVNPLWDHYHIKFFSVRTLTELLTEAGFQVERMLYAGRVRPFAKSMVAVARRPAH